MKPNTLKFRSPVLIESTRPGPVTALIGLTVRQDPDEGIVLWGYLPHNNGIRGYHVPRSGEPSTNSPFRYRPAYKEAIAEFRSDSDLALKAGAALAEAYHGNEQAEGTVWWNNKDLRGKDADTVRQNEHLGEVTREILSEEVNLGINSFRRWISDRPEDEVMGTKSLGSHYMAKFAQDKYGLPFEWGGETSYCQNCQLSFKVGENIIFSTDTDSELVNLVGWINQEIDRQRQQVGFSGLEPVDVPAGLIQHAIQRKITDEYTWRDETPQFIS